MLPLEGQIAGTDDIIRANVVIGHGEDQGVNVVQPWVGPKNFVVEEH